MELNYKKVAILTKYLPIIRKRQLLKRLGLQFTHFEEWQGADPTVGGGVAVVLWTADLVAAAKTLPLDRQELIFNSELGQRLLEYGDYISDNYYEQDRYIPVGHLCIIDRTYAAVTTDEVIQKYLNLRTGDMIEFHKAFAEPPMEVINYNLASVFTRRIMAYNKLTKLKNSEATNAIR